MSGAKGGAFDYLIKLILIGDSGVGKTCFLLRFADDNFTSSHISTIGIDFKIKTINIDGKNVKLQIWDTAGQERFRTITQTYYKGAMGIILAYDCTSEESFNNVRNWVRQIEVHASSNVEKILIGNKADLTDKKVIETEQGQALAKEFGMAFYETSARTGHNVNDTFFHISKTIKDKQQKAAVNNKTTSKQKELADQTTRGSILHENSNKKQKKKNDCCK